MADITSFDDLAALVREARLAQGWSQSHLAEVIGTTQPWISEFERGEGSPQLSMALKITQALGISLTGTAPRPADDDEQDQEIGFGMKI